MSDPPRRPVLHLKSPPVLKSPFPEPKRAAPAPAAAPPPPKWKCKPCGKSFDVPETLADDDAVRCPSCNARLGKAAQFRSDPPDLDHILRARARA